MAETQWPSSTHRYGVSRKTGTIDYDEVEAKAVEVRPQLLIAGGSAYPRMLDPCAAQNLVRVRPSRSNRSSSSCHWAAVRRPACPVPRVRRSSGFDDILHYELPDKTQVVRLLKARLSDAVTKGVRWQCLADLAAGLSYAEITRASNEALKDALIHERPRVRETDIRTMLEERKRIAEKLE